MRLFLLTLLTLVSTVVTAQNPLFSHFQPVTVSNASLKDRSGPGTCNPDSIYTYTFSSPEDSLLTSKRIWRYNGNDFVKYSYSGQLLQFVNIDSSVYDALDRLEFQEIKDFTLGVGQPHTYFRGYFYWHGNTSNADSLITYEIKNGTLQPLTKIVNLFDGNDQLKEQQNYYRENGWKINFKTEYTVTPSGKIAGSESYSLDGTIWMPAYGQTYTYDSNDSLTLMFSYMLVDNTPVSKIEYTYDPIEYLEMRTSYNWQATTQQFAESSQMMIDKDDLGRFEKFETVLSSAGGFYNGDRQELYYSGNSNCPSFVDDYVNNNGQNWNFTTRDYYFPLSTVVTKEPRTAGAWSAYPNPATDWLWLQAPVGSAYQMYDMQGMIVISGTAKGGERLSLTSLSGPILLRVGEGKAASSQIIFIGL